MFIILTVLITRCVVQARAQAADADDDPDVVKVGSYDAMGLIEAGSFFGEYATLTGEKRCTTIVALTYCELYLLSRPNLDLVLSNWPEVSVEFSQLGQVMEAQGMFTEGMQVCTVQCVVNDPLAMISINDLPPADTFACMSNAFTVPT